MRCALAGRSRSRAARGGPNTVQSRALDRVGCPSSAACWGCSQPADPRRACRLALMPRAGSRAGRRHRPQSAAPTCLAGSGRLQQLARPKAGPAGFPAFVWPTRLGVAWLNRCAGWSAVGMSRGPACYPEVGCLLGAWLLRLGWPARRHGTRAPSRLLLPPSLTSACVSLGALSFQCLHHPAALAATRRPSRSQLPPTRRCRAALRAGTAPRVPWAPAPVPGAPTCVVACCATAAMRAASCWAGPGGGASQAVQPASQPAGRPAGQPDARASSMPDLAAPPHLTHTLPHPHPPLHPPRSPQEPEGDLEKVQRSPVASHVLEPQMGQGAGAGARPAVAGGPQVRCGG